MPSRAKTDQGQFPETLEKHILRLRGLRSLERVAAAKGRSLHYLGMTGVEGTDVLTWKDVLDRVIVVERPFADAVKKLEFESRLLLKLTPEFNGNIELVYEDIWDYLCSQLFADRAVVPDVFNLDFCGGLINSTALDYPKQRDAFQAMFAAERGNANDFLIFLTLMPRDRGNTTYKQYLADYFSALKKSLSNADKARLADSIDRNERFHVRTNLTLFKACLPILLEDIGRANNYIVRNLYTRLYTKMIHLAFECTFVKGVLGVAPDMTSAVRVLNAPLRKLRQDGQEDCDRPPRIAVGSAE